MNIWFEDESLKKRLYRIAVFFFGGAAEKKQFKEADAAYLLDKAVQERFAQNKLEDAARKEREKETAERKLEKARETKLRRIAKNRVIKAKRFVKIKKLRKVQRNGSTVFVNQNNDIVHYAILAYLLSDHGSGNSYTESSPSYSYSSSSSSDSGFSSGGSDFGGSFGGGDSGGGGASGSW